MHERPAPGAPERASHAATATVSSKMAGARRILEGLAYTTLTADRSGASYFADAGSIWR
jgi:hypothetical protein